MALANSLENRSKISQLREIYPYIEVLKRSGLTNAKIVGALNSQGFDLSLRSFETMLYRIREEAKVTAPSASTVPPANFQSEKGAHQNQPRSLMRSPESNASADHQGPVIDGLAGLDKKQRRERLADQFITPELTNPLLKRIKDQQQ